MVEVYQTSNCREQVSEYIISEENAMKFIYLFSSLLQMQLLDKFPIEGGQKDPKKRIIPFLPGERTSAHSNTTQH